jgi:hypothetical protein
VRYAVKLGTVMLTSDEPITPEQRAQAVRELDARDNVLVELDRNGSRLVIMSAVDRH